MITSWLAFLAALFTLTGVWFLPETSTRPFAPWLTLAGALLSVYAFYRIERDWPPPEEPREERIRTRGMRRVLALVLFWGGLGLTAWALWLIWKQPFEWSQAGAWAAGLILMAIGASQITGWRADRASYPPQSAPLRHQLGTARVQPSGEGASARRRPQRTREEMAQRLNVMYWPHLRPWMELALVALILSVAIWFRLHLIGQMPPGVFIDETNAALDALHTLEGRPDSLFGTGWFETPNGFIYLQTLFFRLFGTTFAAIKLQSLIPGIFTVGALYLLVREMYGPYPALLAAAFLAFNRWHVNMSRWGWNEVYPPMVQALSLFFIMRAARKRSLGDWAMGGLMLGLGMYTYLAIRMAVIVIFLYLGYRALVERDFLRRNWLGVLLFILIFLLTFAPLGFTYAKNPFTFLNRSQQVSILNDVRAAGGSPSPVIESVKRHLLMFHVRGDMNPRHNLPGAPMLDPITGAFFLMAAAWSLWRWRDHRRGLMILWLGVTLLGGILSRLGEAPQAYRTLAVAPAIAIMAADAYNLTWRALLLPGRRYRLWRWGLGLLMVAGLLAAGWLNFRTYFHEQARSEAVYAAFTPLENEVAREVLARRDAQQLYLSPRLYYFSPVRFFTYRPPHPIGIRIGSWFYTPFHELGGGLADPGYYIAEPATDLPLPDTGQDAAFLLDLDYQYLMDYFHAFYPHALGEVVRDRLGRPLYFRVSIPAGDIAAAAGTPYRGGGLLGRYFYGDAWEGEPFLTRVDPFLLYAWPEEEPIAGPFSVIWTGELLAPEDGSYAFRLEADDGVRFWVDGQVAGESMTPDQPNTVSVVLNLTAGLHAIRIDYFQRGGGKAMAFYWTPPAGPEQPVGPAHLRP
ncbi:MAG TPA: hypothetical protein EYP25_14220 [Anaerolineae bacterium]|nr:hypothetical protein [Anaerolineae bacterium]